MQNGIFGKCLPVGALLSSFMMALTPNPSQAGTVGEIAEMCENIDVATYPTGRCVGYIEGVVDVMLERRATTDNSLFCLPSTASRLDIFQAVISFMRENLDPAEVPAHIIIEYALRVRFPCD